MKTNIIISALTLLALTSCNEFLEITPEASFTDPGDTASELVSKYTSAADATADLNGAYTLLKSDINQMEGFTFQDIRTDNCYLGADDVAAEVFDYMNIDALSSKVEMVWGQWYAVAGSATAVIENTRLMAEDLISEEDRNKIMAKGKFLRAYAYFDIVRLWGAAPMITELMPTITSSNIEELYGLMYPAKSSEEQIYEQVISDLTAAIPYLPSESKGSQTATKGAAYAVLAKVYATMGEKSSRNYEKVVEYCDLVIGEGYRLLNNYDDLWNSADVKFSAESILELYFTTDNPNWAYWVLLKEEAGGVTWRRYCTPTHELLAKYEEGDTRDESTWSYQEVPYQTWYPATNYPLAYKIREKNSDIILIRLADVMLLKAEALVELNKIPEAIAITNDIRKRAGITAWELPSTIDQASARLAVEKERQLELCMEAQRWFDLVRNDRMVEVMSAHKGKDNQPFLTHKVEQWMQYLCVPQSELDLNQNLTQNKGY